MFILIQKQKAEQQREAREHALKHRRQNQKEKRSGLFKKEVVLRVSRDDDEDIDILS